MYLSVPPNTEDRHWVRSFNSHNYFCYYGVVSTNLVENMALNRKALLLSYITFGYNILEGVVSIIAGAFAGSIALIGFGLDSFVESLSGGVMIWRFRKQGKISKEEEEHIERIATKLVAYTFFILAIYVLYESVNKLISQETPERSLFGIIIAIISLIAMPILFYQKYRTGKALNSRSLVADSKETLACLFLSFALLIGLGINYLFGLWQADPIVGLIIVVFLAREGYELFRGEEASDAD
jgi:cation diffusion facilitator family transporter